MDREALDCSFEEFLTATNGHFTLNYEKLDTQNPVTVADKVALYIQIELKQNQTKI